MSRYSDQRSRAPPGAGGSREMSHCSGAAVSGSDTEEGKRPRLAAEVRLTRRIPRVRAISDRPHPRDRTDSTTRSEGEEGDRANEMLPCYARVSLLRLKFPDIKKNNHKNSPSFIILLNFFFFFIKTM